MPAPQVAAAPRLASSLSRFALHSSARRSLPQTPTLVLLCTSSPLRFRILSASSALPRSGVVGILHLEAQDVPESEGLPWRRNH